MEGMRISVYIVAMLVGACGSVHSRSESSGPMGSTAADGATSSSADSGGNMGLSDGGGTMANCAGTEYTAQTLPAALLVVLDRSSSMAQNNKWSDAALAITTALDADVFDSMSVGLYAAPTGTEAGPACIFGLPVSCVAPTSPQIALAPAGTDKSTAATGVRSDIKTWLAANSPDSGLGDASPLYAALQSSIPVLTAWPQTAGKRILLVVTDGTISCNQFSNRPGFSDCNGCDHDWEDPSNIVSLLGAANTSASNPIDTFIVGVPGADTYDATGCNDPPYHMRAALSAMAEAGSPANVPANCTGKTFTQSTPDPTVSCHFDLTQNNFSAQSVADTIATVRGKVLGCEFQLPTPPSGQTVDTSQVNVQYDPNGTQVTLPRRASATDTCATAGCWDYASDGQVELIGAACTAVEASSTIKVSIVVGCDTIVQ